MFAKHLESASRSLCRCHCPINEGGVPCVDCWRRMRKRVPLPLFRICALRQPGFLLCSGGGGRSGPPLRGGFMAVSSSTPSAALDDEVYSILQRYLISEEEGAKSDANGVQFGRIA